MWLEAILERKTVTHVVENTEPFHGCCGEAGLCVGAWGVGNEASFLKTPPLEACLELTCGISNLLFYVVVLIVLPEQP